MGAELIKENLSRVGERVARTAERSGRSAQAITLIGVSKTHPAEAIREAYEAGLRHFGENRVQEWEGKRGGVEDLHGRWHLIGHLQSNKAARAAKLFHSVDSVDDFALAQRLDRAREELGASEKLRVLIEVRVADEQTKSGVPVAELNELARKILELKQLELVGLMCIPPFLEEVGLVRPHFRMLRELRDKTAAEIGRLPVRWMGMSHEFEVAMEEGATEVRVGTALFGVRGVK